MSKMLVRVVMLLPLVLSGCMVRSLSPIYTDKDLVPMPAVEGTWKGENEGETMSFVRESESEGEGYLFTFFEDGIPITASAHFAKIGGKTYLDLTYTESTFDKAKEEDEKRLAPYLMPFVYYATPVHVFYQFEVRDGVARMRSMSYQWAKERREKRRLWIDHVAQDDSTLLVAETVRVQRFIRRWANHDDAWDSWSEIPLVPADAPAPPK